MKNPTNSRREKRVSDSFISETQSSLFYLVIRPRWAERDGWQKKWFDRKSLWWWALVESNFRFSDSLPKVSFSKMAIIDVSSLDMESRLNPVRLDTYKSRIADNGSHHTKDEKLLSIYARWFSFKNKLYQTNNE